jgi:hypothetical protein
MIEQPRRTITSRGWCCKCRANRMITGPIRVSSTGVRRVQGKCETCGERRQCGLLSVPSEQVAA